MLPYHQTRAIHFMPSIFFRKIQRSPEISLPLHHWLQYYKRNIFLENISVNLGYFQLIIYIIYLSMNNLIRTFIILCMSIIFISSIILKYNVYYYLHPWGHNLLIAPENTKTELNFFYQPNQTSALIHSKLQQLRH